MILILDNYDSFTYNLVQFLGDLGAKMEVVRNDEVSAEELAARDYDRLVVSPGPCTPKEAGISCDLIRLMAGRVPVLGVCLGHQSIGQVFGGNIIRAPKVVHGKTSPIHHNGETIFSGLTNPMTATRYHSLIIERDSMPDTLEVIAWTDDDVVMGVKHREMPVWGVQFHPESILTDEGKQLLGNFLAV